MIDYPERFTTLIQRGLKLPILNSEYSGDYVPTEQLNAWISSSLNLLEMTIGKDSSLTKRFISAAEDQSYSVGTLQQCRGILSAAAEEFTLGMLKGIRREVSEELVIDLCLRAEHLLDEGHLESAAVISAAALEECFKRKASDSGVHQEGNDLTKNINALKGAGILTGAAGKLVTGYPKFRNHAMHADWKSISESDIRGICAFLKSYTVTN